MRAAGAPPPIEQLAVIGDRRTAAMLDEDATIVWLCLPWYNELPTLASLVHHRQGGQWTVRCEGAAAPRRTYLPREPVHRMRWNVGRSRVELSDFMPFPATDRPDELVDSRLVVRHVACHGPEAARVSTALDVAPGMLVSPRSGSQATVGRGTEDVAWLLASHEMRFDETSASADVVLADGEEAWFVLGAGPQLHIDNGAVRRWLQETVDYWERWCDALDWPADGRDRIADSASVLHLLSCAPAGAPVAAPTTSLPERLGGDRNYDYRYAWIRDASLTLAALSVLGQTQAVQAYMDWICSLGSGTPAPLQVVYQFNGGTEIPERRVDELSGYAGSTPVRYGNRAYEQSQLDSLGYFADCTLRYLDSGGDWADHYWAKLERSADWTAANWQAADHGIWELPVERHWTSSKVMSWVVLDRVVRIADRVGRPDAAGRWASARDDIHAEVLDRGFDHDQQSFRQHYDSCVVDASLLLIPYVGFLPVDDPRVLSTVGRIRADLEVDGVVYRFDPSQTAGAESDLPMGEYEGGFLVCTFWLASFLARSGDTDAAQELLRGVEDSSPTGLFAEQMDARTHAHLGNTPLLFSHAEYLRARADIRAALESPVR